MTEPVRSIEDLAAEHAMLKYRYEKHGWYNGTIASDLAHLEELCWQLHGQHLMYHSVQALEVLKMVGLAE